MAVQGFFIADLDAMATPATELAGAYFEVDVPLGPAPGGYVSRKLSTEQYVAYLAGKFGAVKTINDTAPDADGNLALHYLDTTTPDPQTVASAVYVLGELASAGNILARTGSFFGFEDGAGALAAGFRFAADGQALEFVFGSTTPIALRALDFVASGAPDAYKSYTQLATAFAALVNGADTALDTLKEIDDQLKKDEQGTAAILATQNQHTTQLGQHTTSIQANTDALAALGHELVRWDQETLVTTPAGLGTASGVSAGLGGLAFRISTPAGALGQMQLSSGIGPPGPFGLLVGVRVEPTDNAATLTAMQGVRFGKPNGPTTFTVQPGEAYVLMRAGNTDNGTGYWQTVSRNSNVTSADLALLNARIFGQNRGPWAANTAYSQYDFVSYQGTQYYANQAFTSGGSFTASNWTQGSYTQGGVLQFVGIKSDQNLYAGPFPASSLLDTGSKNNLLFSGDIQFTGANVGNYVGTGCGTVEQKDGKNNRVLGNNFAINLGASPIGNVLDPGCSIITGTTGLSYCRALNGSKNIAFGDNCQGCVADRSQWVSFGAGCVDVTVEGTTGTQANPFTLAAGEKGTKYLNGVLQTASQGSSGGGATYTAGTGIDITNNVISTKSTLLALAQVGFGQQTIAGGSFTRLTQSGAGIDNVNGWSNSDNSYTVQPGQAGYYECSLSPRLADNHAVFSYGFGIDTSVGDSERFNWRMPAYDPAGNITRNGDTTAPVFYYLQEGQTLYPFTYGSHDLNYFFINLTIKRIR